MSAVSIATRSPRTLTTALASFERLATGANPRLVLGDFLDEWYRTPADKRLDLVIETPATLGTDLVSQQWGAFFAAAVDYLCWHDRLPLPDWTSAPRYFLTNPWFLEPGLPLRAWLLVTTPPAFINRNIFVGANPLRRA